MKIKCEVKAVEETSAWNPLRIKLSGKAPSQSQYDAPLDLEIEVPNTKTSRKSYHVGRVITLEIS